MVFPYPRLDDDEQRRVDALTVTAQDHLAAEDDSAKVERQGWAGDDIIRGLGERGLLGLHVAPEFGGQLDGVVPLRLRIVRPDRIEAAPPSLSRQSGRVADQVGQLRATAEQLLRRHGDEIRFRQRQQKRIAPAAIDMYAQLATISRTTALLNAQGGVHNGAPNRHVVLRSGSDPASLDSSSGSTTTTSRPIRSPA